MRTSVRPWRRGWQMAVVGVVLVAAGLGPPAAARNAERASHHVVRGGWVNPACVFINYDPVTGAFRCTASTTWTGMWTGVTHVEAEGTFDLVTGNGSGTIEETFIGHASDGTAGTLRFAEAWVADGPSLTIHIDARIVEGTGDWVGATGRVSFDGTVASGSGFGGYVGSWARPAR